MIFKVAILQMRAKPHCLEKNTATVIEKIKESAQKHADILLLPECFLTGYDLPIANGEALTEENSCFNRICSAAKNLWYRRGGNSVYTRNHKTAKYSFCN